MEGPLVIALMVVGIILLPMLLAGLLGGDGPRSGPPGGKWL